MRRNTSMVRAGGLGVLLGWLRRWPAGRLAHPAVLAAVRLVSVGLFVAGILTGLLGHQVTSKHLSPAFLWVMGWVGMACVSVFCGNLWALINPWKIMFTWAERLYGGVSGGAALSRQWPYPRRLGVWPALWLYVAFAWVVLVFDNTAVPATLAGLGLMYTAITWAGMFVFGQAVWLRYGEVFSLVFGLLARFSPTEVQVTEPAVCQACPYDCRDQHGDCIDCYDCFERAAPGQRVWNLRPFAVGLLRPERLVVSEMVFVLVLLATVTFDGFMATPLWVEIETVLHGYLAPLGGARRVLVRTFGLVVFGLFFLQLYLVLGALMARLSGRRVSGTRLALRFVLSLVPIAIAAHLAHALAFLPVPGPSQVGWYIAVVTIVAGHIIAVYLAYTLAVRTLRNHTLALRSQCPMLVLMVAYAVVSLWSLAPPMLADDSRQADGSMSRLAAVGSTSALDADTSAAAQVRFAAHAQQRLTAMRPLQRVIDASDEPQVATTVLCYCLAKAPAAVRELRRLAANRFARGIAAWQAQQHHDAIAAFTQTIQLHPRNTWAYMNRGLAHARLGHYPQAQADFTSALALDAKLTAAYYARGLVSILLGQVDEADRDVQRAAALGEPEARRLLQSIAHVASKPIAASEHAPVK